MILCWLTSSTTVIIKTERNKKGIRTTAGDRPELSTQNFQTLLNLRVGAEVRGAVICLNQEVSSDSLPLRINVGVVRVETLVMSSDLLSSNETSGR